MSWSARSKILNSAKSFKLTRNLWCLLARCDAKNEQLQRIYGTAWADKKQLAAYIKRIEEAEKRDHRKIGKALDLLHMQEEAPGMVFCIQMVGRFTKYLNNTCVKCSKTMVTLKFVPRKLVDFTLWENSGRCCKLCRWYVHDAFGKAVTMQLNR